MYELTTYNEEQATHAKITGKFLKITKILIKLWSGHVWLYLDLQGTLYFFVVVEVVGYSNSFLYLI
jgi:hypothetical protein